MTPTPQALAALARAVAEGDPIAWGETALDRATVYEMIASEITEIFARYEAQGVPEERQMVIALATVVKLTVENFVLHQRLMREGPHGR